MSQNQLANVVKSNWYLLLLCAGLFGAGVVMAFRPENASAVDAQVEAQAQYVDATTAGAGIPKSRWAKTTASEKLEEDIETYKSAVANHSVGEETAANLYRLANLYYAKKLDYYEATVYYERLLQNHPNFNLNNNVYPNLAMCYQRLGENHLERYTYKRMRKYFPTTSQEYLYASQQLGL